MGNRWSCEKIFAIPATHWSLREKADLAVRFAEGAEVVVAEPRSHEVGPLPMAFRISYADLTQHGFTADNATSTRNT